MTDEPKKKRQPPPPTEAQKRAFRIRPEGSPPPRPATPGRVERDHLATCMSCQSKYRPQAGDDSRYCKRHRKPENPDGNS